MLSSVTLKLENVAEMSATVQTLYGEKKLKEKKMFKFEMENRKQKTNNCIKNDIYKQFLKIKIVISYKYSKGKQVSIIVGMRFFTDSLNFPVVSKHCTLFLIFYHTMQTTVTFGVLMKYDNVELET